MSTKFLQKKLQDLGKGTVAQRAQLDPKPHFVPVNLKSLEVSLGNIIAQKPEDILDPEELELLYDKQSGVSELYEARVKTETISLRALARRIQNWLNANYTGSRVYDVNQQTLGGTPVSYAELTSALNQPKSGGILVKRGASVVGVLYPNYNSTYEGLFRNFLNKEISEFISKKFRANIVGKDGKPVNIAVGFDVGHILGDPQLSRTPLADKFKQMVGIINNLTDQDYATYPGLQGAASELRGQIEAKLQQLEARSSYGPKIQTTISKFFGNNFQVLRSLNANIVIIQDRAENQYLYGNLLEGALGKEIADLIAQLNFSRNVIQELEHRVESIHSGQSNFSGSQSQINLPDIFINVGAVKLLNAKARRSASKIPSKRKAVTPTTQNLANLQALLNLTLVETVKQNMGKGGRRDILNLRTGRFAESVKVERLSGSRQGMITAFYSYMRNPYATFSSGGRQELPRTRDPKLLISRSIRQIAAQIVGNRLRAQLV